MQLFYISLITADRTLHPQNTYPDAAGDLKTVGWEALGVGLLVGWEALGVGLLVSRVVRIPSTHCIDIPTPM